MKRIQYRVRWKREGCDEKRVVYETERGARRLMLLLGPEPWLAFGYDPDEYQCCSGGMCGCGGQTYRQAMLDTRKTMPELEFVTLEQRPIQVGKWTAAKEGT